MQPVIKRVAGESRNTEMSARVTRSPSRRYVGAHLRTISCASVIKTDFPCSCSGICDLSISTESALVLIEISLSLRGWSCGFTHDQAGLYAVLFSFGMRAALEMLESFEKDLRQFVS